MMTPEHLAETGAFEPMVTPPRFWWAHTVAELGAIGVLIVMFIFSYGAMA